jgi:hypothetical protein
MLAVAVVELTLMLVMRDKAAQEEAATVDIAMVRLRLAL